MVRILRGRVEHAAMLPPDNMQPGSVAELANNDASDARARAANRHEPQTIVRILGETKGRVGGANGAAARLGSEADHLGRADEKIGYRWPQDVRRESVLSG